MSFNMQKLMQEAQKMQAKMQQAQKELETLIVEGNAGGGMVIVEMNGKHQVLNIKISDDAFEDGDKTMLEDLIRAAVNDAVVKIEKETGSRIKSLTAGLNLPEGLGDLGGMGS